MIKNRPKYLSENIDYYEEFPKGPNFDIDYILLPPLLNFDFHTLNGILPLTKSRFDFIGENGTSDGKKTTIIEVNPIEKEYEYYEKLGVTEFQAIQIVINCHILKPQADGSILGLPYSVSLIPMERDKAIDTWNIELLRQFDLRELCQRGGYVYSGLNPFQGWYDGYVSDFSVFSNIGDKEYPDCIGFVWGMYFLAPEFDKKEVIMPENQTFSRPINAKYRKFKTDLYFKKFTNTNPRRIWGCDSPIELFLLQGLNHRNHFPEIQMCIFKNGDLIPNYYKMQENEQFLTQDKLITAADFYFPEKKLAIFCDGKDFHDSEKDERINNKLNEIGVDVLRFSGKEITEELSNVLDRIELKLQS
jgi:hypothetical protein